MVQNLVIIFINKSVQFINSFKAFSVSLSVKASRKLCKCHVEVTLFKKLFSFRQSNVSNNISHNSHPKPSKNAGGSVKNMNVDNDVEELIATVLTEYRSEIFTHGVLSIATNFAVNRGTAKPAGDGTVSVSLNLPFPCQGELDDIAVSLSETLELSVVIESSVDVLPVRRHEINNVTNIIAVASGKGGVGKSTTTVNLAHALIAEGATVGILDADIYGPSIPTMLGRADAKPSSIDGKLMTPIVADDVTAMSIGFLVDDNDATVWRGPMASSAFNQLLNETAWPKLDYLLIDMPPGTGDIQLTLAQKVPVAGAVVITTPQDIALVDAQKGIAMFEKVKVPVLGVIENMSYHICDNCGHHSHLFGQQGGQDIADINEVDLLGQLPLNILIREHADLGRSLFVSEQANKLESESTSDISEQYRTIARKTASKVFYELDMRSPQTPDVNFIEPSL